METGCVSLLLVVLCLCALDAAWCHLGPSEYVQILGNTTHPQTQVGPYGWAYYTADVALPTSELHFKFHRRWDKTSSNSSGPVVCFSIGSPSSPPVPFVTSESLWAAAVAAATSLSPHSQGDFGNSSTDVLSHCSVLQDSETVVLLASAASDSLPSLGGVWYVGVFSIIDASRFQSQMIARGPVYSFDLSIESYGCSGASLGIFCNQPITELPVTLAPSQQSTASSLEQPHTVSTGWHQLQGQCLSFPYSSRPQPEGEAEVTAGETKAGSNSTASAVFAFRFNRPITLLDVSIQMEPSKSLTRQVGTPLSPTQSTPDSLNASLLHAGTLPARHPIIPLGSASAATGLDEGLWLLVVGGAMNGLTPESVSVADTICFTLRWMVVSCQEGWAGPECQHPLYPLQRVVADRQGESNLDSVYIPPCTVQSTVPLWSSWFPLPYPTPLLNHSAASSDTPWAFLSLTLPLGASGGVLTIDARKGASQSSSLSSLFGSTNSTSLNLTILAKARGTPTTDEHDVIASGNLLTGIVNLEMVYPLESKWFFGVTLEGSPDLSPDDALLILSHIEMRLSLHGCPSHCSWHGKCAAFMDAANLYTISYCYCDRTHGGQDCSIQLQSEEKHKLSVYALVISNAAAILPSVWSYRHHAYAEWIVYSFAGALSALYHSCDAGSWCAAKYSTLQFADFFSSFVAVLTTFIYCAGLPPHIKLAFSVTTMMVAAIIARDNTTSGWSKVLVIALGASGLLFGWLLAYLPGCHVTKKRDPRAVADPDMEHLMGTSLLQRTRRWCWKIGSLVLGVWSRFDKRYLVAALFVLSLAGVGWFTETAETYWFWHSLFHISIFSSAYLFLKSVIETDDTHALDANLAPDDSVHEISLSSREHPSHEVDVDSENVPLVSNNS